MKNKKIKAFTLVELAVVLLVIGILAGLVIRNYSGFTGGARDARRLADLRNVSTLLSSYYVKMGSFPSTSYATSGSRWTNDFALLLKDAGILVATNELPNDPQSPNKFYRYIACDRDGGSNVYTTGSAYILMAELEAATSNVSLFKESVRDYGSTTCERLSSIGVPECYPSSSAFCLFVY
ncbi:MAG: hypothetical protein KatS3mg095_0227 [Candidatus Parcubacteria bacterium]|nr:MAG: hypothetical protein KatS3mg095_0227 [Candidatus Parcubacteria bacterium]